MRKLTTEEFIRRARLVHGDKYDYSKVEYKNNRTKVCIICPIHGEFWQQPSEHLRGNECPICARDKTRLTTEEFIRRAKAIHGDFFDYSKVNYENTETEVCIICPIHGEFFQTPNKHLQGRGCPKCGRKRIGDSRRLTREQFILKARQKHGWKYDYSKVEYKNSWTKVCIICPIHGEFWQTPNAHLQGYGCIDCAGKRKKTTEQFIAEARAVWGDKFDYSKTEYETALKKVCIICPEHGEFWVTPSDHLWGYDCNKCAQKRASDNRTKTTEQFISESKEVHGDKYDYTPSEYRGSKEIVEIICPIHGSFFQRAGEHLRGKGCPHCKESFGERDIAKWLNVYEINYIREYWIKPNQVLFGRNKFIVDFYLPEYNTFIEFHGGQHFVYNSFFHRSYEQFQDQQDRDRRLREYCKQHDITLIEIPYTEIDNIDKILTKKILKSKKI